MPMAELNLRQIEDKLNKEFDKEERVIIFWYDEKQEYVEDIKDLKLKNAKIHYLTPTNTFATKVLLERKDKESNYLIYAPFERPDDRENHLIDIILYSKEFTADKASQIVEDLSIDQKLKPVIEKYIKFFNAKERHERFYKLEVDSYNSEEAIEVGLLSAAVKLKVANFEEVVRLVLSEGFSDNKHMKEFAKYGLDEAFWKYCRINFGYIDEEPSLLKLSMSLLLTYAKNQMSNGLPSNFKKHILDKPGTVMAFVDQMMNSNLYKDAFRQISDRVYEAISGDGTFKDLEIENLIEVDVFKGIDKLIINWVIDRLLDENLSAEVKGLSIPEICKSRKFKHFKDLYSHKYDVLLNAYYIISNKDFEPVDNLLDLVDQYDKEYYKIDSYYRKFYYHLDKVENKGIFEKLQTLVENIYINKYLDVLSKEFTGKLDYDDLQNRYKLQKNFYDNFIAGRKERIVVIISDAFRYEIAKELVERFKFDEKIDAKMEPIIGMFPSYTSLGMAALLPNKTIRLDDDYKVFVDEKPTSNLAERKAILQARDPKSDCIQYDELIKMNKKELRKFFTGKQVIYIYHNQIDARAHSAEDEVFDACYEAMDEIEYIIKKLTNNVSATKFIITADHGFIYTRSKTKEADKIDKFYESEDMINRRFIISENKYDAVGTRNMIVSDILGNYDTRTITTPLASNVFKVQGGGQNFVHGGASPQEIIIPVIEVKTVIGAVETDKVKITLISMLSKITNLLLSLDFIQQEPVSDVIKPAEYKICFIDKEGQLISNEQIYVAKSKSQNSADRIFNLKFRLRNQKYNRDEDYYLVIIDTETGMEIYKQKVIIDIAFADDFGFDI